METFAVSKVPYFDIEDTIAEVGISRRQLGHWQDQGLLQPELDQGSNKYTVTDIRRLKALKHLIVDRRFPIPLVKELVEGGVDYGVDLSKLLIETAALFSDDSPGLESKVFDFEGGRLVDKDELSDRLQLYWDAISAEPRLEHHVYDLTLLLFRTVRERLRTPAAFVERRDEILRELSTRADVARVDVVISKNKEDEVQTRWSPYFQRDEDLMDDRMKGWFLLRALGLNRFRDALEERIERGDTGLIGYRPRFWSKEELRAVASLGETAGTDSSAVIFPSSEATSEEEK